MIQIDKKNTVKLCWRGTHDWIPAFGFCLNFNLNIISHHQWVHSSTLRYLEMKGYVYPSGKVYSISVSHLKCP